MPQLPTNCLIIVQGQETSVSKGLLSSLENGVWECVCHAGLALEETCQKADLGARQSGWWKLSCAPQFPVSSPAPTGVTPLLPSPHQVLETCVKNCGHRFHILVANRDFIDSVLVKIISPKNNPPTIVQDKVLALIQVGWTPCPICWDRVR